MDAFCSNYRHVDCLYTLLKHRFSGRSVVKSGQLFDKVHNAVPSNHQIREVDKMPSIAKNRLPSKKYKKRSLSSFQKTKLAQTKGSAFGDRIEQVKSTKIELERIKNVACFLDFHSNYTSSLVSLKMKSL